MEKVIRDGKVAVLLSHRHSAGWYSWNSNYQQLLFHPRLVEMVENGKSHQIDKEWLEENLGIKDVYCGGVCDLEIHWLPIGSAFRVEEHDGYESLITINDLDIVA